MTLGATGGLPCVMRSGFTLIEVLVALLIFEFGMLALAASSAVAARDIGLAGRRMRARSVATTRVEQLRARACLASESGVARTAEGFTEFWRVEGAGLRRDVRDSVAIVLPGGRTASVVVRASVLCAP